jgi:uncharacterized DUF497 family protein
VLGHRDSGPSGANCLGCMGRRLYVRNAVAESRVRIDGFDWDAGNVGKCQKHGVSIAEIEALFQGSVAVYADPDHSLDEQRLRAIGRNAAGHAPDRRVHAAAEGRRNLPPTNQRPVHAREGGQPL